MNMIKREGTFTPDSLIASNEMPILKEGIGLKAGQGVLKRGTLIVKQSDNVGYMAGKSDTEKVFGILTDDIDTGSDASAGNIPVVCYLTGIFNRDAITLDETKTISAYEDELKKVGVYLRNVQDN